MTWGVQKPGDVGGLPLTPLSKDKAPPIRDVTELKDVQHAVESAKSHDLPGSPDKLFSTINVSKFEPDESMLRSALGSVMG